MLADLAESSACEILGRESYVRQADHPAWRIISAGPIAALCYQRRSWGRLGLNLSLRRPGSPIVWKPGEHRLYSAGSSFCPSIALPLWAVHWPAAPARFRASPNMLGATSAAPFPSFLRPRSPASPPACGQSRPCRGRILAFTENPRLRTGRAGRDARLRTRGSCGRGRHADDRLPAFRQLGDCNACRHPAPDLGRPDLS
jgi:hypothetical protein